MWMLAQDYHERPNVYKNSKNFQEIENGFILLFKLKLLRRQPYL